MAKLYSAIVKDKETKKKVFIENKEYSRKQDFIKDLKNNGYAVNPLKVKESEVFSYILNNTNCDNIDWKYINKVPATSEEYCNMIAEVAAIS